MMTRRTDKPTTCRLERIVSGGQTGVDRAALDVALERGLPCGSWCPRGRLAEDGVIPPRYPLTEALTSSYSNRTELNVRDSDATLIVVHGPLRGGTALTKRQADKLGQPVLVVDPLIAEAIKLAAEVPQGLSGNDYRASRARAAWAIEALSQVLPGEEIGHCDWRGDRHRFAMIHPRSVSFTAVALQRTRLIAISTSRFPLTND